MRNHGESTTLNFVSGRSRIGLAGRDGFTESVDRPSCGRSGLRGIGWLAAGSDTLRRLWPSRAAGYRSRAEERSRSRKARCACVHQQAQRDQCHGSSDYELAFMCRLYLVNWTELQKIRLVSPTAEPSGGFLPQFQKTC